MKLYNFKEKEFRGFFEKMNPRLLVLMDVLRIQTGKIIISPAEGAIGRNSGNTQHNYKRYGDIRAIDIFPQVSNKNTAQNFIDKAIDLGFTGIGVYPDWELSSGENRIGFHLDVRYDQVPGNPALWSGVDVTFMNDQGETETKQEYFDIEYGLNQIMFNQ